MEKKEQTRLRVERYRNKRKALHTIENVTQKDVTQGKDVTLNVTHDRRTQHLAEALADPIRRATLVKISKALNKNVAGLDGSTVNLGTMVRYGIGGFTLNEISELLT